MDSSEVPQGWIGELVVVYLANAEAGGMELLATLDEVDEEGIKVSHIEELGTGPVMFCPWYALRKVRLQQTKSTAYPPPGIGELPDEAGEEFEEDFGEPRRISARNLERVVPVTQKQTVEGVTVALSSLELYGEEWGVLRWQISFEEPSKRGMEVGIPEPRFKIRNSGGGSLTWTPGGGGASNGESDGEAQLEGLPDTGVLEVEVARVVADVYDEGGYEGMVTLCEGPWSFRLEI